MQKQLHTTPVVFVLLTGLSGEIPLNMKPSTNREGKWRETFSMPLELTLQQTPFFTLSATHMSWHHVLLVSGFPPHHLVESTHTRALCYTEIITFMRAHLHLTRHLWAQWGERPVSPCLVCSSGLSNPDKTHEALRSNRGVLQWHDRYTALLLQTYCIFRALFTLLVTHWKYCRQKKAWKKSFDVTGALVYSWNMYCSCRNQ